MQHGAEIGTCVFTQPRPGQPDLAALSVAGENMEELVAAAGCTDEGACDAAVVV